jgi:hypothetical protein
MPVTDEKVAALAYSGTERILEIAFHSGQVWQLSHVPEGIYKELCDATISSFLQFIAKRYNAVPVKTGIHAVRVPATEVCFQCKQPMSAGHQNRSAADGVIRVKWDCPACRRSEWRTYGAPRMRERRTGSG